MEKWRGVRHYQKREGESVMDIPKGYKEIDFDSVTGIFVSEKEIVITGFPKSDDETHNCDYMGCSSISHVIFRADITNIR